MDFLEYGMKYEHSRCIFVRAAARILLAVERKRADCYEKRLDRKQISLPEDPEGDAALLQKIRDQIVSQNSDKSADGSSQDC